MHGEKLTENGSSKHSSIYCNFYWRNEFPNVLGVGQCDQRWNNIGGAPSVMTIG